MAEESICILCGAPAPVSVKFRSRRTGSVMVLQFCTKHEKARLLGNRRTQKAINKRIREMFK